MLLPVLMLLAVTALPAADVTEPGAVDEVMAARNVDDIDLSWIAVTLDAAGNPETIDHYNIYRGETPDFVPDKTSGSNRIGQSATASYKDVGGALGGTDYYYLVSAVDTNMNEGLTRPSTIVTPPVLSGYWTDTTIELSWTAALPESEVDHYLVYYGQASGQYDYVDNAGLALGHSLTGLETNVNWYAAVVAVDAAGNASAFSNEHIDPIAGTIDIRAHDESEICWGAEKCTPVDPEHIQRSNGFQILVPAEFPEGDWTSITLTFTMDSRLCNEPTAPDRCGDQNPGWNPCGDPWDRTAHLFMVLDDCIEGTSSCMTHDNLELLRSITPFGTDAPEPDGRGIVPPRVLTFDITPFAPLLAGHSRYVGAHIGHYTPKGWWVTSDFHFSKRPEEESPKPPADGFEPLFFGGATPPTDTVTIPATATSVITRLFTTGHGGNSRCDGGSNDGGVCTDSTDCPGGSCANCDEFCHRNNRILVDGSPVWEAVPWRNCCWPRSAYPFCPDCADWNSCGYPSCTFNRAGWCPGEIACHYNLDDGCDQDLDMTAHFPAGGTYDVDYDIQVNTGSWSISLMLYWYED